MAKRYGKKRKNKKGKREPGDDLFGVKVTKISDKKFESDLLYHMSTNRCPYNKLECDPDNCPYGTDGMDKCPIHQGDEY